MKTTCTLLLPLLLLTACVAENVERRKPRKGPIKEVGFVDMGGGSVRYSTDGWKWFVPTMSKIGPLDRFFRRPNSQP